VLCDMQNMSLARTNAEILSQMRISRTYKDPLPVKYKVAENRLRDSVTHLLCNETTHFQLLLRSVK
jgi:hypothetical protein